MKMDALSFFSPFPPTQSGVSDYSFAIAKSISRENDVLSIVKTPQEKDFLNSHGLAADIFDETAMPAGLSCAGTRLPAFFMAWPMSTMRLSVPLSMQSISRKCRGGMTAAKPG